MKNTKQTIERKERLRKWLNRSMRRRRGEKDKKEKERRMMVTISEFCLFLFSPFFLFPKSSSFSFTKTETGEWREEKNRSFQIPKKESREFNKIKWCDSISSTREITTRKKRLL
jgi:hypothetical protein